VQDKFPLAKVKFGHRSLHGSFSGRPPEKGSRLRLYVTP
jgi:hypothetical protein